MIDQVLNACPKDFQQKFRELKAMLTSLSHKRAPDAAGLMLELYLLAVRLRDFDQH
jgi:hypothetical protein